MATRAAGQLIADSLGHIQTVEPQADLPRALAYLAEVSLRSGHQAVADRQLERALALFHEAGDAAAAATALQFRANHLATAGEFDEADQAFTENLAISRESRNKRLDGRGSWPRDGRQRGRPRIPR